VYVLVLSAVVSAAGQDKVDLKLRLKAGESHEMKMTQTQDVTQTMMGQEQKMKQTQEMIIGFDCLSVDANGNMDIEMTYKSMKMAMDGPMGHMEFDSANPKPVDPNRSDEKMIAAMFSAMVGSKFQMKNDSYRQNIEYSRSWRNGCEDERKNERKHGRQF